MTDTMARSLKLDRTYDRREMLIYQPTKLNGQLFIHPDYAACNAMSTSEAREDVVYDVAELKPGKREHVCPGCHLIVHQVCRDCGPNLRGVAE